MNSSWQESVVQQGKRQLAIRCHGPASGIPVIALHGWRDNAATFELLGPLLPEVRIIAIDMPGHGLSSWRDADGAYYIWSYLGDVLAVVEAHRLERFSLLGHSMGGAISCLLAGLMPERINKLALLDAVGPLATAPSDMLAQMLKALQQAELSTRRHYYPSFEAAVAARAAKGLEMHAATLLARRGVAKADKGYYWTLDPRLSQANLLSLTEEQVEVFIRRIACAVLLIAAPAHWPDRKAWFERRRKWFSNLQLHALPGHHHQHLEGQVDEVAILLRNFFNA